MNATLKNVGGWTPVIDSLVGKYGRTVATCFGVIWRFAQMDKTHLCQRADSTLAHYAGVSRRTFQRAKQTLLEEGYIQDIDAADPAAKQARLGLACRLRDTGKVRLVMMAVEESDLPPGEDPIQ